MGYVWVDNSDIDLTDFSDEELVEEIHDRGNYTVMKGSFNPKSFDELYKDYKTYGFTEKFQKILEEFFEEIA